MALSRHGRPDEAIALYRQILESRPDFSEAHNNLGNALGRVGLTQEAVSSYREAIRHRPHYPEAQNNLGIALARQGKVNEAATHFEEALRQRPEYPEAHNNLGNASRTLGRLDQAVACYRKALAQRPAYPEAQNNLGNALAEQGKLEEAVACYQEALRLKPSYAEAHNNLGNTLSRSGQTAEAVEYYRRALRLNPDYAEAYNNLGNALTEEGGLAEAVACYREALRLKPDYAEAQNNLGITLGKQRKYGESGDCFREALRLNPEYADAHLNRALSWLQSGQFEQGWVEYEWRWRARNAARPDFAQPAWNGEPLHGKPILLYVEQGLGDTFQFIRYAPLVKRRGGFVILECQPQLAPLLSRCQGIDRLVAKGSPAPEFQSHCALLSLPAALRTTLTTIPSEVPYLFADPSLINRWRRRLAGLDGYQIGINWQGNPQYKGDRHRSIRLEHFAALAELPGVRLISLQKGLGSEQLEECRDRFEVTELNEPIDESAGAFMDTAAILMNLDLFITSDTAVAHLAGGLGVPTWLALSWTADWRWLDRRADSPWYPTLRLFRQGEPGDWNSVFRQMADELRPTLESPRRNRPILVEISAGELIDKLTVLQIKAERIRDPRKLQDVHVELAALQSAYARAVDRSEELETLATELRTVNERLWTAEDSIRVCDAAGEHGSRFIELAQEVYRQNDRRTALKMQINSLLGSRLAEVKSCTEPGARDGSTSQPS